MKLYLHIGTHKTGSTAIQEFLKSRRDQLLEQDIYLPISLSYGDVPNHRKLPYIFSSLDVGGDVHQNVRHKLTDREDRRNAKIEYLKAFEKELAENRSYTKWIISSEQIYAKFTDSELEGMENLKELLYQNFDEIEIILYIRRQVDFAISFHSSYLKAGDVVKDIRPARKYKELVNYHKLISRWRKMFPDAKLHVRLFDRKELTGGDINEDISNLIGFVPSGGDKDQPANASLNALGLQLLRLVNERLSWTIDGRANPLRKGVVKFFEQHFSTGASKKPTADQIEEYENFYAASNERVRKKYFPEREVLFAKAKLVETPNPSFDEGELEALADVIAELWEKKAAAEIKNSKLGKKIETQVKKRLSFVPRMKRSIQKRLR